MLQNFNSRKYRMGIISMIIILLMSGLIFASPLFLEVIHIFVGGIVSVYGLYCGMNVANKWALGKAQGASINSALVIEAEEDTLQQPHFPEDK